jgi:hypothetical protein
MTLNETKINRIVSNKSMINGFNPIWFSKSIKLYKIKEIWKMLIKKHSGKK